MEPPRLWRQRDPDSCHRGRLNSGRRAFRANTDGFGLATIRRYGRGDCHPSGRFRASVYGQVQLATSQDFDSDSIRLRATFRFGAKIADVERVVKLAVTDLGS